MVKSERQLNIELLRIFAMFYIVLGHLSCVIGDYSELNWIEKLILYIPFGFVPGVNCFVLISSYFLINAQFKAQRIVRILVETLFYTVILTIICFFFFNKNGEITIYDILKSFYILGPSKYNYWFISKFIALLVLQPFLSKLAMSFTKKQYQFFLCVLIFINTDLIGGFPFGGLFGGGFTLMWFICLFFTGGYLRLHAKSHSMKFWLSLTIFFTLIKTMIQYMELTNIISLSYNSIITYGLAISVFMLFNSIRISEINGFVKFISPNILGVYLIHEHGLKYLYRNELTYQLSESQYWNKIAYLIIWSILIFFICICIDKFRQKFFNVIHLNEIENKISTWLQNKYEAFHL